MLLLLLGVIIMVLYFDLLIYQSISAPDLFFLFFLPGPDPSPAQGLQRKSQGVQQMALRELVVVYEVRVVVLVMVNQQFRNCLRSLSDPSSAESSSTSSSALESATASAFGSAMASTFDGAKSTEEVCSGFASMLKLEIYTNKGTVSVCVGVFQNTFCCKFKGY